MKRVSGNVPDGENAAVDQQIGNLLRFIVRDAENRHADLEPGCEMAQLRQSENRHVVETLSVLRVPVEGGDDLQSVSGESAVAEQRGAADWRGDYTFKTPRDNRWGYGLAGGGGIALLIDRFELNFRVRYYFGYADILRNRNRYADNGIDGSENPFAQTPMRSPLDNLMISVGVNFRFNKEGFETWKPRPKRAKAPEAFTYGK